jgi:hypothetical protein
MRQYASGTAQVYNESSALRQKAAIPEPSDQPVYMRPEWRTAVGNFLTTLASESAGSATSGTLK